MISETGEAETSNFRVRSNIAFTPHLVKPRHLWRGWRGVVGESLKKPRPLGRGAGFTFLEILIVISVIGVLAALSLPKFQNTFYNLQLNSFASQMQTFMNYLHERAIVEGKIIYLVIDKEKKEFFARFEDPQTRLKTYHAPQDIVLETDKSEILFYPDGQIDKVTIKLSNPNKQNVILTTKGVFGSFKLQYEK